MLRGTLVAVILVGCSSANPEPSSAESAAAATPGSKGAVCLADATAARDRNPDEPSSIGAAHILVRHAALERPKGASRSREEACLRAMEAREALLGGMDWGEAVEAYSDAAGATQGDLGSIRRDDVKPKFADAAFALEVDALSYVVETDAGFHIILRTE